MSQDELTEHRGYLADRRKVDAYRAALAEVVEPGDVVLDLGAGTGLLGYLACEAGAGEVVAVDAGEIIGVARRIARDNGYADRITHLRGHSTEIELTRPADVVVCDQIGGLVHDAGILACFADARRRLLRPGGRLVPASFGILLAPVTYAAGREAIEFWSRRPAALDVSAARPLAANTEWRCNPATEPLVALAPGCQVASFPSDHDGPITGSAEFTVRGPGRLDGFAGWFVAQMSPSVTLTNDPWSPERFDRWTNFYPLADALAVDAGDRVGVAIDIRPTTNLVSWQVSVTDREGGIDRYRHSTFEGSFLTLERLHRAGRGGAVACTDEVGLAASVLALIDGRRTQAEIIDALAHRIGSDVASRPQLERFVHRVVGLTR